MAFLLEGDAGQQLFMQVTNELLTEAQEVILQGDDEEYANFLLDFGEEILEYRSLSLIFQKAQLALTLQKMKSL